MPDAPAARFARLARAAPDRVAVIAGRFRWTRGEIERERIALANVLVELGVRRGDRVLVARRNSVLHFTALLACASIGAVMVPVNFRLPAREVATIAEDCLPTVIIAGPRHARDIESVRAEFPPATLVVDDHDPITDHPEVDLPAHWRRLHALYESVATRLDLGTGRWSNEDLLMLQYTSGSTGTPKGVRLTLGNHEASWRALSGTFHVTDEDVVLAGAPFGHVGGLNTLTVQALLTGGVNVVLRQFDAEQALALIQTHGVTAMFGVPSMYEAMARQADFSGRALASLRLALVGGAPVPGPLAATMRSHRVPLVVSWGMTETCGGCTFLQPSDLATRPDSVGTVADGVEVRAVDEECGAGELLVRGPTVSRGYWGNREPLLDEHGWYATGDCGWIDREGYVYLVGRSKHVIISGGENIWPAEIENALRTHPSVADVAVVGVPDARWGETPYALIVPVAGETGPSLDVVREYLSERIARYKLPRHLRAVGALPLGPTGKVDYSAARSAAIDWLSSNAGG